MANLPRLPVPSDFLRSIHMATDGDSCVVAENTTVYFVSVVSGRFETAQLPYVVRAVAVNAATGIVVVGGDAKVLDVYRFDASAVSVTHVTTAPPVGKRVVTLSFASDDSILIGDKFGEVYRAVVAPGGTSLTVENKPVVAHLGMVTFVMSRGECDALVTADRDGNLRVSSARMPAVINGFLWMPLAFTRAHDAKDTVFVASGWAPTSRGTLVTGSLDGFVAVWDLTLPSVDGSDALIREIAKLSGAVVGFATSGDKMWAAVDGDEATLRGVSTSESAAAPGDITVNAPVLAASGRVVLHRDGSLSKLCSASNTAAPLCQLISKAAASTTWATIDVKEQWHTREAKPPRREGGGDEDDDGEQQGGRPQPE